MRVLTVQQPWAWAIVTGAKPVENRTQLWQYRGPVAIHAGARLSERGCQLLPELLDATRPDLLGAYADTTLTYGAILGTVDLVDAHRDENGCCDSPWAEHYYRSENGRWGTSSIVHLVLENPRAFTTPVPDVKGRLGLWTPDADLADAIQSAA